MQGIPHRLGIGLRVQSPGNSQLTIGWLPMFRYAYRPPKSYEFIRKCFHISTFCTYAYLILYTSKRDSSLNGHFWDLPKKLYNWFKHPHGEDFPDPKQPSSRSPNSPALTGNSWRLRPGPAGVAKPKNSLVVEPTPLKNIIYQGNPKPSFWGVMTHILRA